MAEAEEQQPEVQEPQGPDPSAEIARNKMDEAFWDVKNQRIKQETLAQNQVENLQKQKEAYQEKVPGITGAIQEREKALEPIYQQQAPTLPQPPKLQNFLNKDVATMLLGVGSVIAGLNSSGRARGIRANKSLAAGINGYVNGNFVMAKMGLEDWKNQVDTQLNEYKLIRQNNMDILNARGLSIEDKTLELELAMKPYGFDENIFDKRQNAIDNALKFDKELADIIYKTQLAAAKVDPILQRLKLKQLEFGVERAGLGVEKAKYDLEKARTTHSGDEKPGPAGYYYDKSANEFLPSIPTRGELRESPQQYVRMSSQQRDAVDFLKFARQQVEGLKPLASSVLSNVPGKGTIAGMTSRYRKGGADMQEFKERTAMLVNEATRLETGGNRVLAGIRKAIEEQLPDPSTHPDVAERQLKVLDQQFSGRLKSILGATSQEEQPSPGSRATPGKPEVMRAKDVDGKPIWKLPNETKWHYE